ncbi:MAG: hypothetical protein COV59_02615 [Candidatus Magasanikbacteria bacterium CG11_big_fil_rev_8_21_14_0_20_39_34]|uniref:PpiC domain-containing protein n=1 Tax=Candidatus Magasanikbacteria bacterium CG11_big_fil_rev_8_21_14_0_20_39_34 TaxID=1974653 RepID=A0A2H0N578_9BACT|nr:MAG: hypothetical protein COV59_02615 [Candidatus Magasanikbacteria bacterium CG11_big_fil_rev_8_21_14_0_20_39_34]
MQEENEKQTHTGAQEQHVAAEPGKEMNSAAKKQSGGAVKGLIGGVVIVLLIVIVAGFFFLKSQVHNVSQDGFVLKAADVLHLSAASINGRSLSYTEYINQINALSKFSQEESDAFQGSYGEATDEQISNIVLARQLINLMVEQAAHDFDKNIVVTDEDIQTAKQNLLAQFGGTEDDANTELQRVYGWSLDQYVNSIMRPALLEEKLAMEVIYSKDPAMEKYSTGEEARKASHILFRVTDEETKEDVRKQAQDILDQIKNGADFAQMASQYGTDGTKDFGGDLGWFTKGAMVPEFEEAVFGAEPGALIDHLVETSFGFHIIKVTDSGVTHDFKSFLDDKLKEAKIRVYLNVNNPLEEVQKNLNNPEAAEQGEGQEDMQMDMQEGEMEDTTNAEAQ